LALAVIGHYDSSCSVAGGNVYKANAIPAITPASVDVKVTLDNDWYFRNVNNSHLQGRFFANYFNVFTGPETKISIVYEKSAYGSSLARALIQACKELNIDVKYMEGFPLDEDMQDMILQDIVDDGLASLEDPGIIFLSTHASSGAALVKLIRDAGIRNLLGGPDSFASKTFHEGFRPYPLEKLYPGYYSNQVFVFSSLLFDSANENTQKFKDAYEDKYKETPLSYAAYAYDAAMLIAQALKNGAIQGKNDSVTDDRKKIRDYLAGLSSIDYAVEGVTGFNYFDENGDVRKEINIGLYKSSTLISTFNQLRSIHHLNEISDVEKAIEEGDILNIDGRYMYKNKVVKTGVKFNGINNIDINSLTCELDFNLWFRYQGRVEVEDIVFENAVEPIRLGKPVIEKINAQDVYRLYKVRGKFKVDFFSNRYAFGQHVLGIRFHHRTLTRNKLIFVPDIVGMGMIRGSSSVEKMKEEKVISPVEGSTIRSVRFFENTFEDAVQGRPEYLNLLHGFVEHSAFNAQIRIKKDSFILRGLIPFEHSKFIVLITFIIILLSFFAPKRRDIRRHARCIWFFQIIIVFILLLSGEVFIINSLVDEVNSYHLKLLNRTFGMLYWIASAFLLCRAVNCFAWMPLEDRTGRKIPIFLRRFVRFIIYLLAMIGIIAFVFGQKVTSLLATSGVFAMVIGLAVQINISNVFSGIAINMERPFRLGDWIEIGEMEDGEVIDITWRATRVKTRDGCVLSIPNSTASESVIKNYHYPDDIYELWFPVYVDPVRPPEQVERILLDAAFSVDIILKEPCPIARLNGGLNEWAAKYYLIVCVKDRAKKNTHNDIIWKSILTHLHSAGISPARRQEIHLFQGCSKITEAGYPEISNENIASFVKNHSEEDIQNDGDEKPG